MCLTSKFIKFLFNPIKKPTMNFIRAFVILMIFSLGWNTFTAGMRAVKALDHRVASQLEMLAD